MHYYKLLIIFLFYFVNSFSQQLTFENGIYIEIPDTKDTIPYKYSIDNVSYVVNKEFVYDYVYIDSNHRKFKFIKNNKYTFENPLNLIQSDSLVGNYIDKIKITVCDPLELFSLYDTSYTQTIFSYDYLSNKSNSEDSLCKFYKKNNRYYHQPCGDEYTGLIDNKMNLWIHPPRQFTFRILQLCPYPFYYLDENVNNWTWELTTSGLYLDNRWIKSTESITIKYDYKRMPEEKLKTPLGDIQCKVTYAIGTITNGSIISYTSLKSYYHPNYGFVKLEYNLINKNKIIIDLIETK